MSLAAEAEAAVAAGSGLNVYPSSIMHSLTQTMSDPVFLITGAWSAPPQ
jgi:hypothetical protein